MVGGMSAFKLTLSAEDVDLILEALDLATEDRMDEIPFLSDEERLELEDRAEKYYQLSNRISLDCSDQRRAQRAKEAS